MAGGWSVKFLADPVLMEVNRMHPRSYSKAQIHRENGIHFGIYLLFTGTSVLPVPAEIYQCFQHIKVLLICWAC